MAKPIRLRMLSSCSKVRGTRSAGHWQKKPVWLIKTSRTRGMNDFGRTAVRRCSKIFAHDPLTSAPDRLDSRYRSLPPGSPPRKHGAPPTTACSAPQRPRHRLANRAPPVRFRHFVMSEVAVMTEYVSRKFSLRDRIQPLQPHSAEFNLGRFRRLCQTEVVCLRRLKGSVRFCLAFPGF